MIGNACILKIYMAETDKLGYSPLYEEIVKEAQKRGIAGATVYRGILSYGASHSIHTMKIFALSDHLPVVLEIVDEEEKIRKFAARVQEMIFPAHKGVLITIQRTEVIDYRAGKKDDSSKK